MEFLSTIALFIHILAILVLLSTMPRQLRDILQEKDIRYRKICWVIFLGTICLISTNILPLLEPFFYNQLHELAFNSLVGTFNALIGIILGILAHLMYKSTKYTVPRTIDEIDNHIKNGKE